MRLQWPADVPSLAPVAFDAFDPSAPRFDRAGRAPSPNCRLLDPASMQSCAGTARRPCCAGVASRPGLARMARPRLRTDHCGRCRTAPGRTRRRRGPRGRRGRVAARFLDAPYLATPRPLGMVIETASAITWDASRSSTRRRRPATDEAVLGGLPRARSRASTHVYPDARRPTSRDAPARTGGARAWASLRPRVRRDPPAGARSRTSAVGAPSSCSTPSPRLSRTRCVRKARPRSARG